MKKLFLVATVAFGLMSFKSMGQININGGTIITQTPLTPDNITINTKAIANTGELNLRVKTSDNATDAFEIRNAGGGPSDGTFTPLLLGTRGTVLPGNIGLGSSLVLMSNIDNVTMDVNNAAPMMLFSTRRGYSANNTMGVAVVNRPTFQWINGVTPQMTMLATGHLGLGTINPESKFHVVGDIRITKSDKIIFGQGNDGIGEWLQNSNSVSSGSSGSHGLSLFTNSKERMRVTNLGMVGIGVSNPTATLHVAASPSQTSAPSFIRFEKLPQTRCGYILMVDDNGYVYRSTRKGNPCVDTGACQVSQPTPVEIDIFERYETLAKKFDALTKEVETLKTKIK